MTLSEIRSADRAARFERITADAADVAYLKTLSDEELQTVAYGREERFENDGDPFAEASADRAWAEKSRREAA